ARGPGAGDARAVLRIRALRGGPRLRVQFVGRTEDVRTWVPGRLALSLQRGLHERALHDRRHHRTVRLQPSGDLQRHLSDAGAADLLRADQTGIELDRREYPKPP